MTDGEWERLGPLIPAAKPGGGRTTSARRSTPFRNFQRDGLQSANWERLHLDLREDMGCEASPTVIVDSQSIKSRGKAGGHNDLTGYDAGKREGSQMSPACSIKSERCPSRVHSDLHQKTIVACQALLLPLLRRRKAKSRSTWFGCDRNLSLSSLVGVQKPRPNVGSGDQCRTNARSCVCTTGKEPAAGAMHGFA